MIYYFSATGNSRFAAERIAAETGDRAVNIVEAVKNTALIQKSEVTGFVFPVYFWGLPEIVKRFASMPEVREALGGYVYCVITCGASTGSADKILGKRLGRRLDYSFSLRMPDNYVILYDPCTREKAFKFLKHAEKELETVCAEVNSRAAKRSGSTHGAAKSLFIPYFYDLCRTTGKFYADENCVACGFCEKNCPDGAISIKNGKPDWVKNKCQHCTACINLCPAKAIQFGKSTEKRGRYNIADIIE